MKHAEDAILFSNPTALVQMPWNYCNILRDASLSFCVVEDPEAVVLARLRQSILQNAFQADGL